MHNRVSNRDFVKLNHGEAGFSLMELMVSLGVSSILALGTAASLMQTVQSTEMLKSRGEALSITKEIRANIKQLTRAPRQCFATIGFPEFDADAAQTPAGIPLTFQLSGGRYNLSEGMLLSGTQMVAAGDPGANMRIREFRFADAEVAFRDNAANVTYYSGVIRIGAERLGEAKQGSSQFSREIVEQIMVAVNDAPPNAIFSCNAMAQIDNDTACLGIENRIQDPGDPGERCVEENADFRDVDCRAAGGLLVFDHTTDPPTARCPRQEFPCDTTSGGERNAFRGFGRTLLQGSAADGAGAIPGEYGSCAPLPPSDLPSAEQRGFAEPNRAVNTAGSCSIPNAAASQWTVTAGEITYQCRRSEAGWPLRIANGMSTRLIDNNSGGNGHTGTAVVSCNNGVITWSSQNCHHNTGGGTIDSGAQFVAPTVAADPPNPGNDGGAHCETTAGLGSWVSLQRELEILEDFGRLTPAPPPPENCYTRTVAVAATVPPALPPAPAMPIPARGQCVCGDGTADNGLINNGQFCGLYHEGGMGYLQTPTVLSSVYYCNNGRLVLQRAAGVPARMDRPAAERLADDPTLLYGRPHMVVPTGVGNTYAIP